MSNFQLPKLSFWRVVVTLIFFAGNYATLVRFGEGLAASTNLTDTVPWGLWVGLNTLCGVGLSAGGFAIAAAVYMLGLERYRSVLRASILVSFLGYLSVIAGMFYELGLPWRIWYPIVLWNRRSVLFEVAWCVMLYTTVLTLEFSPAVFERFPWVRLREWFHRWHTRILIALVLVGVILSSLHQSFLGGLYLITKGKLDPLWYSSQLPALFLLSAIPAGLAVVVMALYLSARSLSVRVEYAVLERVGRVIPVLLAFYGIFRGVDLLRSGGARFLWQARPETELFWLEVTLLVLLPLILLSNPRLRANPLNLYWSCAVVVMGFMANRVNVAVTGLQASSGVHYVPKWMEFVISLTIVTAAVVAFRAAVLHLNIFPRGETVAWAEAERRQLAAWRLAPQRSGMLRHTSRPS